jgi:hypothetical protein
MGYLANTIQFFGATCFQISVICGLPGALPEAGSVGGVEQQGRIERIWIGAYWAMQVRRHSFFFLLSAASSPPPLSPSFSL